MSLTVRVYDICWRVAYWSAEPLILHQSQEETVETIVRLVGNWSMFPRGDHLVVVATIGTSSQWPKYSQRSRGRENKLLSSVHKDSRNLTTELLTLTANEAAHAVNTRRHAGKPYNAADARRVNFPWHWQPIAVLNLIFDYPFLEKGCTWGFDYGRPSVVYRAMVCSHLDQYKPPLYLAPFGRNLRCKFWLGVVIPSLGRMDGRRGWRWVPWVVRWWLGIGSP